jgi:hypothetical protein
VTERFDDDRPSADEAELIAHLRDALGPDPLPEGLLDRAEGLLAFRDVDRELVELLEASNEPAGLRGEVDAPERLVFEVGAGVVSVEVVLDRDAVRGQVLAGDVTEVGLERLGAPVRTSAVDELGQFSFAEPEPGPVRLRLHVVGGRPTTTDWFQL